jgi:DNA-binding MarR family transcriptional regulator
VNPTTAPADLDIQLVARLRLVISRLARRLRQQAEKGITPSGLSALASIERLGPCTLGALAAHERVQPPTMTRIVVRLEEDGLVDRIVDPEDRRVSRVALTGDGRQTIQRIRSRKNAYLAKKLRKLSAGEIDALTRAVDALERILEEDDS